MLESIRRFAVGVKRTHDMDFGIRVGINTGPVVVAVVDTAESKEHTAMGDAVNITARMQQTAAADPVQISAGTHRLVAHAFDTERLGGLELKGKSERVRAFRVLRAKTPQSYSRGVEPLDSPW